MAGINRALHENRVVAKLHASSDRPCIFISHISVDQVAAIAIGKYIMRRGGIDIYLDINDLNLQVAVLTGDPDGITEFIERGLLHSSHIMCLVSDDTVRSWWVPYELGFAKNAGKRLSTLKLKGDVELPAYLEVSRILNSIESLNKYLERVRRDLSRVTGSALTESLIPEYDDDHPLVEYLDWTA